MAKFEYEKIEPVLPGCHIEGWQAIRKKTVETNSSQPDEIS